LTDPVFVRSEHCSESYKIKEETEIGVSRVAARSPHSLRHTPALIFTAVKSVYCCL